MTLFLTQNYQEHAKSLKRWQVVKFQWQEDLGRRNSQFAGA